MFALGGAPGHHPTQPYISRLSTPAPPDTLPNKTPIKRQLFYWGSNCELYKIWPHLKTKLGDILQEREGTRLSTYFLTISNKFLGLSRFILVFLGLCRSVHLGLSRSISDYLGLSRSISVYLGQSWTISDYLGLFRTISNYLELSRTISDYLGMSWNI